MNEAKHINAEPASDILIRVWQDRNDIREQQEGFNPLSDDFGKNTFTVFLYIVLQGTAPILIQIAFTNKR